MLHCICLFNDKLIYTHKKVQVQIGQTVVINVQTYVVSTDLKTRLIEKCALKMPKNILLSFIEISFNLLVT